MMEKLPKEIEHFVKNVCMLVVLFIYFLIKIVMERSKNKRAMERICKFLLLFLLFLGNFDGKKWE
jgi:hypothetical protein